MKIKINLLKEWFEEKIDIYEITNLLTKYGFETIIEDNLLHISVPSNRLNAENLFSILNELKNDYKIINKIDKNIITEIKNNIKVIIKEHEYCKAYYYITIENINNEIKTPNEILEHLKINNINSNNFIIDITNYITLLTGQPLSVYDKEKIKSVIILEKIKKNKIIKTINNTEINLKKNTIVLHDKENIISIPGIINTFNSKVDINTKNILIESALFEKNLIKKNEKIINLSTESSNIFKNEINFKNTENSLIYLINIIKKFQNIKNSKIKKNVYINQSENFKFINLNKKYFFNFIGNNIEEKVLDEFLKKINIEFKTFKNHWKFKIPKYRTDIKIKENIISEIIKKYGYNKIKEENFIFTAKQPNIKEFNEKIIKNKIINFLTSKGFQEVINYTFVEENIEKIITNKKNLIKIVNPMSEKLNVLRSNLIQGLIKNFKFNINRDNEKVKMFEIGYTYTTNIKNKIKEEERLALICSKDLIIKENKDYTYEDINFYIIKKILENIVEKIYKEKNFKLIKTHSSYLNSNYSADIILKKKKIGEIGLIEKEFLKFFEIKNNLYFLQINILKKKEKEIKIEEVSKFPKIKKDISILVEKNILYEEIINHIKNLKVKNLINIEFISIYEKENKKSINIKLTFQSLKKTLTDKITNKKTNLILEHLKEKLNN